MPYQQQWVDPEVYLEYHGVTFYCTYRDDDCENNPPRTYDFVMDPSKGMDDSFNVEELPGWKACPHPPYLTGENDTPLNRLKWDKWYEHNLEANYIRKFLIRMIDYFEALGSGGESK